MRERERGDWIYLASLAIMGDGGGGDVTRGVLVVDRMKRDEHWAALPSAIWAENTSMTECTQEGAPSPVYVLSSLWVTPQINKKGRLSVLMNSFSRC